MNRLPFSFSPSELSLQVAQFLLVRAICLYSLLEYQFPRTYVSADHLSELSFVHNLDPELACLVQLASRILARE